MSGCEVEGIRVDSLVKTEAGSGESDAGLHPKIKEERRKMKKIFLNDMMFELRQIIFVLREEFVGHLADFGE